MAITALKAAGAALVTVIIGTAIVCSLLWQYWRPGMEQYQHHLAAAAQDSADGLTASWYGVSGILIRDGEHAIFIDPFFSRPGGAIRLLTQPLITPDETAIRAWLRRAGVAHLDAVLVSHSHYDHAMDAGVVAKLTGAKLMGSHSTLNIGRGATLSEDKLIDANQNGSVRVGPFTIQFIESQHAGASGGYPSGEIHQPLQSPASIHDYRLGGVFSILIQHADGNLLHLGSAGTAPGALENVTADAVFLGVAMIDDLNDYLDAVVYRTGATRVYPVHWDDFTRPLDKPLSPMPFVVALDRFFESMRAHNTLQVQTLQLGVPVSPLNDASASFKK